MPSTAGFRLKNGKTTNPAEQISSKTAIDATRKHPFPPRNTSSEWTLLGRSTGSDKSAGTEISIEFISILTSIYSWSRRKDSHPLFPPDRVSALGGAGLLPNTESRPMDHDSDSSGYADKACLMIDPIYKCPGAARQKCSPPRRPFPPEIRNKQCNF